MPLKLIVKLNCKMNILTENIGLSSYLLVPPGSFHAWNFELYYPCM